MNTINTMTNDIILFLILYILIILFYITIVWASIKDDIKKSEKKILKKIFKIQNKLKEEVMKDQEIIKLLEDVKEGKKTVAEAALILGRETGKVETVVRHETSGGGCQY